MDLAQQPPAPPNPYTVRGREIPPTIPADALELAHVELATPGIRLLARIVDNVVFFLPIGGLYLVEPGDVDVATAWNLSFAMAILFIGLVFAQAMLISATGASIGKRVVGIKMIHRDGSTVGFLHGWLIRTFLYGLLEGLGNAMLFGIPALVDSLMIFTQHGQTLHDRMAGTYVVKAR